MKKSLKRILALAAILVLAFMVYMLVRPYKEASKLTTKVKV